MRTPVQRTLISLAVASACWNVGIAHAQQVQPEPTPAADSAEQATQADAAQATDVPPPAGGPEAGS